jgi:hypothetical protein
MKIKTYSISAEYFVNGRENVDGMAMRDDLNDKIVLAEISTDRAAVEALLDEYQSKENQALYRLSITSDECEADDE